MQKQHTVLCIQDLSCVGRCSLAVVLPALAAMGVQPCALPTALLSTHTGGLGRPARTDESGFISAALAHYAQLGLAFDCVYSGYLAGAAQVALVEQAFRQAPAALKLVDPVMADHGRPYASMTPEIRAAVAQLCGQADVIVPNATEAALLLEELPGPAADGTHAARHASLLLQRFPALRCAVVTGGALSDGQRGNVCAVRGRAPVFLPYSPVPQDYPGTGDLFAAVLTGGLLRGFSEAAAIRLAARFVALAAEQTFTPERIPASACGSSRFSERFPTGPKRLHSPVRTLFFRCKNTRQKERNLTHETVEYRAGGAADPPKHRQHLPHLRGHGRAAAPCGAHGLYRR